ncbi:MAG: LytTR family DNA-binding domain-containing protein [Bacteroidetes bacterium]|nr:LytTR family DNA-binding domain-containing protein [Bacteroidota bacterium]
MIRCLAIDDEKLALELIEDNIRKVPFLELVQTCRSAIEAMEAMRNQPVDLLFLDIRMPDISGLQLLRSLLNKPLVILTTAYSNYAKEGFDLDVIDYLLKPYSFERFLKAVNKANEYLGLRVIADNQLNVADLVSPPDFLFVKADYRLVRINLSNILYIEGLKDYVKIYLPDKTVVTQMSMKSLEEKLPSQEFIRVHRSYIVSFSKIESIQKYVLTIGKKEIPVSEPYREKLFRIINSEKSNQ